MEGVLDAAFLFVVRTINRMGWCLRNCVRRAAW